MSALFFSVRRTNSYVCVCIGLNRTLFYCYSSSIAIVALNAALPESMSLINTAQKADTFDCAARYSRNFSRTIAKLRKPSFSAQLYHLSLASLAIVVPYRYDRSVIVTPTRCFVAPTLHVVVDVAAFHASVSISVFCCWTLALRRTT